MKKLLNTFIQGLKSEERYAYDDALIYYLNVENLLRDREERGSKRRQECIIRIGLTYLYVGKTDQAINILKGPTI